MREENKVEEKNQIALGVEVLILMGSQSDYPTMKPAEEILKEFGVKTDTKIVSAHRTPEFMVDVAKQAHLNGVRVIIAGAGGAAHLPGMLASLTPLPVIGVPVPVGHLQGNDALLSIVQMPTGVPVATVAIGNATNAGILAAQILASAPTPEGKKILDLVVAYKQKLKDKVLSSQVIQESK